MTKAQSSRRAPSSAHERSSDARSALPSSSLSVWVDGGWRRWWQSSNASDRWSSPDSIVARAVHWTRSSDGAELGTVRLGGTGVAWRIRATLLRLDPRRLRISLAEPRNDAGPSDTWTIDSLPGGASLAFNAGQFALGVPWGWVVRDGVELQPPRAAPLASAVVIDSAGAVRLLDPGQAIAGQRGVAEAFQSYPTLLAGDGDVPAQLRAASRGVDVAHRDSRLALGVTRDGHVIVLLTRFDALGDATGALSRFPVGPTVPELAALMGALGCRAAVALDGGLSGQLVVRDDSGHVRSWPGLRTVPLAVVARPAVRSPVRSR